MKLRSEEFHSAEFGRFAAIQDVETEYGVDVYETGEIIDWQDNNGLVTNAPDACAAEQAVWDRAQRTLYPDNLATLRTMAEKYGLCWHYHAGGKAWVIEGVPQHWSFQPNGIGEKLALANYLDQGKDDLTEMEQTLITKLIPKPKY